MKSVRLSLLLVLSFVCSMAQSTFVYTNNDIISRPNSVSGFSVDANGSLTPISGSPFLTGGIGAGTGFFASNRITSVVKGFLYAGNGGSDNVSAFAIDPSSGILTPVPGSPFATGGTAGAIGISLAATPDDNFLIAASGASNTITVYSIGADGGLKLASFPFLGGPGGFLDGIKVTPDGKFLVVAHPNAGVVSMFGISPTGVLTSVPGSPFPASGPVTGVDCDCKSSYVFAGNANLNETHVSVFTVALNGALSQIPGSPFTWSGFNSNVVVLSPDDKRLFVSNQGGNTVTVFSVAASGVLTSVPGSPFAASGASFPSGMATNQSGTFLYVTSANSKVYGYSIAPNGTPSPVLGSPFSTGAGGLALSLTVFPPKSCCPVPIITGVSATPQVLWPPNHMFVDVTINYTVTDSCPNTCGLTVASNESTKCAGVGNTCRDWEVIDAHQVLLRAERAGGRGHMYTITIICTNDSNKAIQTVTVLAPHDKGK
jgi:6-phosphogluconolactonase (cycloisomerase 2 family)